ncbi:MAG: NUDIX domain-containing protein [Planctomycetota bacterium]
MFNLEHHVRVFVFQVLEQHVQYLLLRQKPVAEWPLGPVVGAIAPDEHLQDAVVREVAEETGIHRPLHVIDLSRQTKELFGDMGMVEWNFAYQAGTPSSPIHRITPGPLVGDFAWLGFEEAFQKIGRARDRETLVKLQLHLHQN